MDANETIRILLVEDNPSDVELFRAILADTHTLKAEFEAVIRLDDALERLQRPGIDLVLLDLNLPDCRGYETFARLIRAHPELTIIILTGLEDEQMSLETIRNGAQDYLLKDWLTPIMVSRSLQCAIERGKIRRRMNAMAADLREANTELERLTNVDPLTNLLNRRGLIATLSREFGAAGAGKDPLTAVLVDLDNFRQINDSLGYAVGDMVLRLTVRRLQGPLREGDVISRIGGDEFLILLPNTGLAQGRVIAEKIRLSIGGASIASWNDAQIHVTPSIGLVETTAARSGSLEEILVSIYPNLHKSKQHGKNTVTAITDPAENGGPGFHPLRHVVERVHACNLTTVLAQSIHRLSDNALVGYEFLSRSCIKDFEMPEDFFRLCIENNVLTLVDSHCFKCCLSAGEGLGVGLRRHVNIFPSTLINVAAEDLMNGFANAQGPGDIFVEISEQQILEDPAVLDRPIRALKAAGARVALDDVGFGRSHLESLVRLVPDCIKIDKSQVTGAGQDAVRLDGLKRILKVADALGIETIAEGVETQADAQLMRELGVTYAQGFHYSRPAPLPGASHKARGVPLAS